MERPLNLLIAVVLAAAASAPPARAGSRPARTLTVTGHAELRVPAELARIVFGVETLADSAARATAENARLSRAVATALRAQLGPQDRLETTAYTLEPRYRSEPRGTGPPSLIGYAVRNEVRVSVHALDRVGTLIDLATRAGANRVAALTFALEDPAPHHQQALAAAARDAARQATALAEALGVRLERITAVSASPSVVRGPRPLPGFTARAAATTPVEPGEIRITASVQVTYEIR